MEKQLWFELIESIFGTTIRVRDKNGECPVDMKRTLDHIARIVNSHDVLLEAAKHLGACDLAGETIEYRCPGCVEARKVITQA